jgi:hypothetical protein
MAISPSHKFGQIIGDTLEAAILPLLVNFAKKHGLYLDRKGRRPCRKGLKCSWTDLHGNTHGLDFVLERGGTQFEKGTPVAFIETAWRRYTKHSRNKAQEIQGAIEPLAETYKHAGPFKGAVLAGVFTDGALEQLRSLGFTVLFFPYETVITAFKHVGIDAFFDETTPDIECQSKVDQWKDLFEADKEKVTKALLESNRAGVRNFVASLKASVARHIDKILILPLHGRRLEVRTIDDAVKLIQSYDESVAVSGFERYEIQIRFSNGNDITGRFSDKPSAIEFLHIYQPATS